MEENEETNKRTTVADGTGSNKEATRDADTGSVDVERMEEATKAMREERLNLEETLNRVELGGQSEAGMQPIKEEPISDVEFAKQVAAGTVNPLQMDGFI